MKNILILLALLISISARGQTTYPKITQDSMIVITPLQLKKTNLIFLEHKKFSKEIPLLKLQVNNLENINKGLILSDSLKTTQIDKCMLQLKTNNDALIDLNESLKKEKAKNKRLRNWAIGGFSVSVGLIAVLLLVK